MTDYVKSTNFTSKDSLPSGNALKIIKGTEFDVEFNNIVTAVSTKADSISPTLSGIPTAPTATAGTDTTQIASTAFVTAAVAPKANLASPTFTGVPAAPTATAGTNTTQLATTAFIAAAIAAAKQALHPIGSLYINASVTTNPATLLGFGTWTAFGAGRVMVGLNGSDTLFDALEETGGSKDAAVVSHTHTFSGTTDSAGAHVHTGVRRSVTDSAGSSTIADTQAPIDATQQTDSAGVHAHTYNGTTASTGSSATNANLQPYITVAVWKRTA